MSPVTELSTVRALRLLVGVLMAIETAVLLLGSCGFGLFALFFGGLASIGAAGVSEEKFRHTWLIILLSITVPFIWTLLLFVGTILVFRRRHPKAIVILCSAAIVAEVIFFHVLARAPFMITLELPAVIPLMAIVLALNMRIGDSSIDEGVID